MQIYLDANATTPVLPEAREAALAVMAEDFGNPSSTHEAGLKAGALLARVRETARRVIGAPEGRLVFNSGATEGIQTAVLSALQSLRVRRDAVCAMPSSLLYGATEHKAVPEALRHWNTLLDLGLDVVAIPVDANGRHDLAWLRAHAHDAGLVCTMAANNETGVVSDLHGIADALDGSGALWLVDGVQALGKLPLNVEQLGIDYAPFSGHKLYAPKGIGMLYVREGAPFTPLLAGGGQEGAARAGTENMAGIAALGVVLSALETGTVFATTAQMTERRERLAAALREAFAGLVFNAPLHLCLPTTLNFCVAGADAKVLLNLFDAGGVRVSSGSACSAAKAQPSQVLLAMALPQARAASAVRLSFGAADSDETIDEACRRIRECGMALRASHQESVDSTLSAQSATVSAAAGRDDASRYNDARQDADGAPLEHPAAALQAALRQSPRPLIVDVREPYEQRLSPARHLGAEPIALSALAGALPRLADLPEDTPVYFVCRSGKRSAQAALALRKHGHARSWSLAGGLALWPDSPTPLA